MGDDQRWCRATIVGPDGQPVIRVVVSGPGAPDLRVVDAVALFALFARRTGASMRLVETSATLAELLELAGLAVVAGLGLEMEGQAEAGE
jgi:hypothetical protein